MKIVVTGSLGHISKPLTEKLLALGHDVTVISSSADRKPQIEALGAKAAIGRMQDTQFLAATFAGADIIYCMESLGGQHMFFDKELDIVAANVEIGRSYAAAIAQSGLKKVVHLSSIGAHRGDSVGMLRFHYQVEQLLRALPQDVAIKFMRPVGFYYNTLVYIPTVKARGIIVQNYGGDEREPWVSTDDIATVIAEEMELPFEGRTVRYIASEELSPNEVAQILGEAIGSPITWVTVQDEEWINGLMRAGMSEQAARGLAEMNAARRSGVLYEDYNKNRPLLQKTKLTEFAKTFATVYNS